MEGLQIPRDLLFFRICPYLSLKNLRFAMRVSRSWFFTLISDEAFSHFKTKILRISPELKPLFDAHPWEYGDERTAHSMRPSKGKSGERHGLCQKEVLGMS